MTAKSNGILALGWELNYDKMTILGEGFMMIGITEKKLLEIPKHNSTSFVLEEGLGLLVFDFLLVELGIPGFNLFKGQVCGRNSECRGH